MRLMRFACLIAMPLIPLLACRDGEKVELNIREDVSELLVKFAPVEIRADISFLPENEKAALEKLIEASRYMDEIFLRQVWQKNPVYREALMKRTDQLGVAALEYFRISVGLWDRLDEHEAPFIGSMEKPAGAGYYPEDMTVEEFDAYLAEHPDKAEELKSLFTVVERQNGELQARPYSEVYRQWLEPAAKLMREAAELTDNQSLRIFLNSRAAAFFSDDYYESDMHWMDLDSPIEITIGPYEVYEDKLLGLKAAFESYVTISDPAESQKLARYKSDLPAMERNLPIPDNMKNLDRGTESPIRVVDVVFTAGDAKAGVQTIAFNLPNDERVREAKGSKKVLLRNVIAAKYEKILSKIADELIQPDQVGFVTADAFTNEVLFHELAHGLGPGKIVLDGEETEVRLELKELYTPLEEAKADIMGIYNLFYMIDKGLLPKSMRKEIATTYLAGLFRGIRFGIAEAHGMGNALQFNYMMEKGAIVFDEESSIFSVDYRSFGNWVRELVQDICILQANGDYAGTQRMFDKYVIMPPYLSRSLAKLDAIPVDIVPQYTLADELTNGTN